MFKLLSWLLEKLFPPKLPVFNIVEDMSEIEKYQYRISRRGVELNPSVIYAGRVKVVTENSALAEVKFFTVSGK